MKVVIVGCGRVGATIAEVMDREGHDVTILDVATSAFDRLPETFRGNAIRGDGTDEDVLRRAGAEQADLFLALTEGDNRNVMAAQLALEELGARQVIAKVNDPVRAEAYAALGVPTLCRTLLLADAIFEYIGQPTRYPRGVIAPTGTHPGAAHPPAPPSGTPAGAGASGPVAVGEG